MRVMASTSAVARSGSVAGGAPDKATPPSPRRETVNPLVPISALSVARMGPDGSPKRSSRTRANAPVDPPSGGSYDRAMADELRARHLLLTGFEPFDDDAVN